MNRREIAEVRDGLQRVLEAIRMGELTATPGYVARLEGAIGALDAVLKQMPTTPRGGLPVTTGPWRHPDVVLGARDGLRSILESIRRGDMGAGAASVAGLEGALAALDGLVGEPPDG